MEYHLPSQFDSNGVNIMSPIVQNGGVGYPTPPGFKYNGDSPQQTMQQNFNNPYQQQYGSPYSTGMYTSANPYEYYCQMGQQAAQQLNAANTQFQQLVFNYGYINPYYPGYGYYQQPATINYHDMYNNGQMGLSDYLYYDNGGLSYTFTDTTGHEVTIGARSATEEWYGAATSAFQRQQEYQKNYMNMYNEQMETWNMLRRLNNRFFGKEDDIDKTNEEYQQKMLYYNKWQKYYYDRAVDEYNMDCLSSFIQSLPNSTQKGYMSPVKENIVTRWNNYYHQRNDKYPENYGIDEFFNKGIMVGMIIDDMEDDAKRKERQLNRLYDQKAFRQMLHEINPFYDPEGGYDRRGVRRLGVDDIEITLPPHLAQKEYVERRQKFMDTIFKDQRCNLQTKY